MRVRFFSPLVLGFCAFFAVSALGQFELVKKSPFEATKTRTAILKDGSFTVSERLVRNSDSSIYQEWRDLRTGKLILIAISDAPSRRCIYLDPKLKTYSTQEACLPAVIPDLPSGEDLQKYIEYLKAFKSSHESGGYREVSSLGFRTQDGFEEFGRRIVVTEPAATNRLKKTIWEEWSIPALSVTVEMVGFDAAGNLSGGWKLTDMQVHEPDPRLFEIPEGYVLATPFNSK